MRRQGKSFNSRNVAWSLLLVALISGCDGQDTEALSSAGESVPATANQEFSDVGVGTATLSWMPPIENSDGSQLVDLAGYEIWYGRVINRLDRKIEIANPSINVYIVEGLGLGVWYFNVVSVNSRGVTSAPSATAAKTIAP